MLLRNRGVSKNNWIALRAEGTTSNRFGLGATVRVQIPGALQVREINNVASYQSANDIRLHVGLGAAKTIPQIEDPVAERDPADPQGCGGESDFDSERRRGAVTGNMRNWELETTYSQPASPVRCAGRATTPSPRRLSSPKNSARA